jgi:hypothetical protein
MSFQGPSINNGNNINNNPPNVLINFDANQEKFENFRAVPGSGKVLDAIKDLSKFMSQTPALIENTLLAGSSSVENDDVNEMNASKLLELEALMSKVESAFSPCMSTVLSKAKNISAVNNSTAARRQLSAALLLERKMQKTFENTRNAFNDYRKQIALMIREEIESQSSNANLTPKQKKELKEKELNLLVAQINGSSGSSSSQPENKKGKQKKVTNHTNSFKNNNIQSQETQKKNNGESSSSSSSAVQSSPQPIKDPVNTSLLSKFKVLKRVDHRWKTTDVQEIAKFEDYVNGTPVQKYARNPSESDDDFRKRIETMRFRHYLPGLESLLSEENRNKYYYNTDRGCRFIATLVLDEQENIMEYGDVFLGIGNDNTIFHKFFEPWSSSVSQKQIVERFKRPPQNIPSVDDIEKAGGGWEPAANGYSYKINVGGTIEFSFKNSAHKLLVHPLT